MMGQEVDAFASRPLQHSTEAIVNAIKNKMTFCSVKAASWEAQFSNPRGPSSRGIWKKEV